MGLEEVFTLATGALFISLICWRDANQKISRKTSNNLLKAFVYCIFLLLALLLYVIICYWFVPELFAREGVDAVTFSKVLGIAVLTFGAGSTTYFENANLKVSPYRMLLDLLMSTIPDPTSVDDLGKLRKEVRPSPSTTLDSGRRSCRMISSQNSMTTSPDSM